MNRLRLWGRSAARPFLGLSFPAWNTSISRQLAIGNSPQLPEDDIENDQCLELLHPFTGAKALYISLEFTLSLPLALLELAWEEETEVLSALETIFLEDNV